MTYGNLHRFFLRSVATRGVFTLEQAENFVEQHSDGDTEQNVHDIVKLINDEIRPFQQTIKITKDETTDETVLVFLSLGYDDATKAQNLFSANELEFFRLLIEEIMCTDARQVTSIHAINIVGKMKGSFTKTDAQKLLNTWCQMFYLEKIDNNYALGVRAIHEFESYLRQNMPDTIEECCLCKQIVFRGYNCPGCAKAVHTRCLNQYLEKVDKWPCCKADYDASQLARLNNESSRLSQSRRHQESMDGTEQSEAYDTSTEPNMETTQEITQCETEDLTQNTMPGISQCVTRKRKRQRE